jgi:protein O-GlcNAc transferase
MGVPIVTLPSDRLLGRQSASHLLNIGLPEFIARDAEDYVGKAVTWSRQLERLAGIRSALRERMRASPLVDQTRFAESFVLALEEMRARAPEVG